MISNLETFENKNFGKLTVIEKDGEFFFIAKEVAAMLGYVNPRKAVYDHVDEEDKGVTKWNTPGGIQNISIINESGLYSLILSSKLPQAKIFKAWVTREVLPSIRKNGGYIAGQEKKTNEELLANAILVANRIISEREEEIEEFLNYLDQLQEDDFVIISGSIPKSLGDDFYRVIVNLLEMNNVRFAIDTSGKKLFKLSSYKPFLVKPNKDELSEIFEDKIDSDEKIVKYARKLIDQGAENVIVSLGKDGSMFIDSNIVYKARPIEGKLINSVGSGDSMVAGYIYGYMKGFSKLDSYKLAVSCGSATAFSPDIAEKELIDEIFKKVELEKWE